MQNRFPLLLVALWEIVAAAEIAAGGQETSGP
jgi:hypothetical protein